MDQDAKLIDEIARTPSRSKGPIQHRGTYLPEDWTKRAFDYGPTLGSWRMRLDGPRKTCPVTAMVRFHANSTKESA